MRKYRGLTKEGKWVYGCYLFDNSYGENRSVHLIFPFEKIAQLTTILHTPAEGEIKRFTGECYQVIPESVGQSLSVNNKKFYVGDIVKFTEKNPPPERKPCSDIGIVEYNDKEARYDINRTLSIGNIGGHNLLWLLIECNYEIIGNIHQNPELMEKT